MSLRARLTLWNTAVLAAILFILGSVVYLQARSNILAGVDRGLKGRAERVVESGGMGPPRPFPSRLLDLKGKSMSAFLPDGPWDSTAFTASTAGRELYSNIRRDGEDVRVFSRPVVADGKVVGVVQTAVALTEAIRAAGGLIWTFLTAAPFAFAISIAAGLFLTSKVLRPVGQFATTADQISGADLSARLPDTGNDEFGRLGHTFNEMLDRVQAAFEGQRRFVADASHELKTPLTIIKGSTGLALRGERTSDEYRQALKRIDTAAAAMSNLVGDLLLLARADEGRLGQSQTDIDVDDLVCEAAAAASRPVKVEPPATKLTIHGDRGELLKALSNLLENSVRYGSGGAIVLRAYADHEMVLIQVQDEGEGIPSEHLDRIWDRFYRIDDARARQEGGTGLGLAIVRSIVEAHGGVSEIESTPGVGTTVTLRLPSA